MPETLQSPVPTPLTALIEDEILFRDNIRQFADEKIRPLVKEMDEKGIFEKSLIQEFFQYRIHLERHLVHLLEFRGGRPSERDRMLANDQRIVERI